jgi:hypothetical protein
MPNHYTFASYDLTERAIFSVCFDKLVEERKISGEYFLWLQAGNPLALANEECMPLLKPMIENAFPQLLNKWQTYITFG